MRQLPHLVLLRYLWMLYVFAALGSPSKLSAGDRSPPAKEQSWIVDDLISGDTVSDVKVSPDGKSAAWIQWTVDLKKNENTSTLVVRAVQAKAVENHPAGKLKASAPAWSPDGEAIAFLAPGALDKHDDPLQLWIVPVRGGQPKKITTEPTAVLSFAWAGSESIVFRRQAVVENDDEDAVVIGESIAAVCLFRVSVKTKHVEQITNNTDRILGFALDPSGNWALTSHECDPDYDFDNRPEGRPKYFLNDLRKGTRRRVFADVKYRLERARWAADGKGFYAASAASSDARNALATISELFYLELNAEQPEQIDIGSRGLAYQAGDDGLAGWENDVGVPAFEPTPDGILALCAEGTKTRLSHYRRTKGHRWEGSKLEVAHQGNIFAVAMGAGSTVLYSSSTASTPPQWYASQLDGNRLSNSVPMTNLNRHLDKLHKSKAEVFRWKGAQGDGVEGLVFFPHNYKVGKRYPLVLMPHGGPALADRDEWSDDWSAPHNLLAQRGAFVLKPNYHGSSGYGLAWVESIRRKYLDLELKDLEAGVDALIAKDLVDEKRLAIMGASNGAVLGAELTTRTDRYKAACLFAGTVEQVSDWGATKYGAAFGRFYFGQSPLEGPKSYIDKSAFFRLNRVKTPTLIMQGADDRQVGPHQGWLHYRALRQHTKTPARFVSFPGAGHWLDRPSQQRRKVVEDLRWLDAYLFRSPPD